MASIIRTSHILAIHSSCFLACSLPSFHALASSIAKLQLPHRPLHCGTGAIHLLPQYSTCAYTLLKYAPFFVLPIGIFLYNPYARAHHFFASTTISFLLYCTAPTSRQQVTLQFEHKDRSFFISHIDGDRHAQNAHIRSMSKRHKLQYSSCVVFTFTRPIDDQSRSRFLKHYCTASIS